ncbi:hypothetical protein LINPERHAP1_LOCUS28991, partial [Linum perenne]
PFFIPRPFFSIPNPISNVFIKISSSFKLKPSFCVLRVIRQFLLDLH